MQETTKQPLFDLGQLVATPGALAALEKAGQTRWIFFRAMLPEIGETFPKKTIKKTNSAWNKAPDRFITQANRSHTTLLLPDEY